MSRVWIGYHPRGGGMTGKPGWPVVGVMQDEKTVKEIGVEISHKWGILARPLWAC